MEGDGPHLSLRGIRTWVRGPSKLSQARTEYHETASLLKSAPVLRRRLDSLAE